MEDSIVVIVGGLSFFTTAIFVQKRDKVLQNLALVALQEMLERS